MTIDSDQADRRSAGAHSSPDAGESLATIFVCCPRLFDIRYLASTAVIKALAGRARVVVFVPSRFAKLISMTLGNAVTVRELQIAEDEYEGRVEMRWPLSLRYAVCRGLANILGFVYGNQNVRNNLSQSLHIRNFLGKRQKSGLVTRSRAFLVTRVALLASSSKALRSLIKRAFFMAAPKSAHWDDYQKFRPSLVVTCSFGLGLDGILMAEARKLGIPIITAVQSWDKTSTKGYPTVMPEAAIVWSDVTADEAEIYLDMPRQRLYVEGAPLWDKHFSTEPRRGRSEFFTSHGLDPQTRLIAVSIGSPCYHEGNLRLIEFLIGQLQQGGFGCPVSLIFRQHPGYLSYESERAEMLKYIGKMVECRNVAFMDVELDEHGGVLMYREADSESLCELFAHCDLSISIVSSHLIEAAIFGKPAINIEYGQWTNDMYDFDLSEYTAEHLYRIYRTGAVYRASSEKELLAMATEALGDPARTSEARGRLVDQEAPVNRGCAAERVAARMARAAESGGA